ncbi:Uncharacterized protein Fot_38666 [Forsythia ovata]|uniref:Uncharacterized protein n=1 Tax=Forsythia ovata TaxID=205694 RepID=A0ABD1S426_9LAMI
MDNGFEASQAKRPCLRLLSANNKKAYDGSKSCRRSVRSQKREVSIWGLKKDCEGSRGHHFLSLGVPKEDSLFHNYRGSGLGQCSIEEQRQGESNGGRHCFCQRRKRKKSQLPVDDALTGQHVAYSVLERANEKIRLLKKESSFNKSNVAKLRENVVASEAEVAQLKAELEASAKEKSDAE